MAENTSPQAITWSNEQMRPLANSYMQLKNALAAHLERWGDQIISQYIPNTTDQIADGAQADGRPINENQFAHTMASKCQTLIDVLEANEFAFAKIANLPFRGE